MLGSGDSGYQENAGNGNEDYPNDVAQHFYTKLPK